VNEANEHNQRRRGEICRTKGEMIQLEPPSNLEIRRKSKEDSSQSGKGWKRKIHTDRAEAREKEREALRKEQYNARDAQARKKIRER
jgi:hypothetical protein